MAGKRNKKISFMRKQKHIVASVAAAAMLLLPSIYAAAQFTMYSGEVEVYRQAVGTPDSMVLSFTLPEVKASQECDPSTVGGVIATSSEAVDLGLSVKWAPWNIGANSAGEAGAYFAWGEVQAGKEHFWWDSYWWMVEGQYEAEHITKYQTEDNGLRADWYIKSNFIGDGKTTLEKTDDAAAVNWGGKWRMPTSAELEELSDKCTWEWKEGNQYAEGSIAGYLVTGPNGKSIFLPAAGNGWGDGISSVGSWGTYWSSDLSTNATEYVFYLSFGSSSQGVCDGYPPRCIGFPVRAVYPSE